MSGASSASSLSSCVCLPAIRLTRTGQQTSPVIHNESASQSVLDRVCCWNQEVKLGLWGRFCVAVRLKSRGQHGVVNLTMKRSSLWALAGLWWSLNASHQINLMTGRRRRDLSVPWWRWRVALVVIIILVVELMATDDECECDAWQQSTVWDCESLYAYFNGDNVH